MFPTLFIGGLGGPELVIIFMLVVLLFGANKLPKLARASGEAMGEFQKGREEIEQDIRDAANSRSSTEAVEADIDDDLDIDADVDADDDLDTDRNSSSA